MEKLKESLGNFEQLTLSALVVLGGNAYGLQLFWKMCELGEKQVNLGSMYVTLDRLEKKGYLNSQEERGTPERGGKRKKFYNLIPKGAKALQDSLAAAIRLSETLDKSWGKLRKPKRAKK